MSLQVAKLRKRFFHSIAPGGLAGDRRGVIPALGFSFTQQIWKAIKENKNIDLLAHEVMIAIVRCEEIANAKIDSFLNNEEWRHLEDAVQNGIVPDFAKKLSSILENCLIGYDKEAVYFDDSVRTLKRQQLESKLFQYVQPAYRSMLKHLVAKYSEDFNVRFNEARKSGGAIAAFNDCSQSVMFAFDEDCKGIQQTIRDSLKVGYAKSVAESKEKEEEAGRALMHMKDRFSTLCSNYSDSTRKLWMGKEDKKVLHIGSDLSLLNRRSCAKE
ncbi:Protein ROOT HAIR DEFECTIVE 3 [Dendrobium catenatum]|uniref:Protein ROOT HAIR DEFECTIVE 3 n=1 Tax=Dendrobium catenatum TaxID=906689 RepID=A0A2I0W8R0_9ASPA|nr:Protein ROOT HAIR DEFECTIVE 3 [Dendrobium catenatum]